MFSSKHNDSPKIFPATKQQLNFHQALTTLQNHCSNFFQNLAFIQTQIHSSLSHLHNTITINNTSLPHLESKKNQAWPTINDAQMEKFHTLAMSEEAIEERLEKVPVYAVSNPNEEFVVTSKGSNGQSLALLCFEREDAETLLKEMKSNNHAMRKEGFKVVPVPLNKVFQLKVEGVSFRLVPDFAEVMNAVLERKKNIGNLSDGFWGVPVFQAANLAVTYQDNSYRPVFFRMEDLQNTLKKTASQQGKSNQASKQGRIQVAAFEDIIQGMKDGSTSMWDDVIFIPPGFDASVNYTEQEISE